MEVSTVVYQGHRSDSSLFSRLDEETCKQIATRVYGRGADNPADMLVAEEVFVQMRKLDNIKVVSTA